MGTLVLLRHATAGSTPGAVAGSTAGDAARTLTERGHRQAREAGRWLRERSWLSDRILCSTAVRARQTLEGLLAGAGVARGVTPHAPSQREAGGCREAERPGISHDERLYLASPELILHCVAEVDDSGASVMVVAHNPGLFDLANRLAAGGSERATQLARGFPPASLAVFATGEDAWSRIGAHLELIGLHQG